MYVDIQGNGSLFLCLFVSLSLCLSFSLYACPSAPQIPAVFEVLGYSKFLKPPHLYLRLDMTVTLYMGQWFYQ
jgi:hypothetical protein